MVFQAQIIPKLLTKDGVDTIVEIDGEKTPKAKLDHYKTLTISKTVS